VRTILRFLGYLCLIAVAVALVFGLVGDPALLPLVPGWFLLGIVLLSLATILDRLTYLEFLVKSSSAGAADRIHTDLGDFERLGDVEGEATCLGCRRIAPKAGLYYHKGMDVYYHPECLARDYKK
jgi:hypothetical protein